MPRVFRKRAALVVARQWDGTEDAASKIIAWLTTHGLLGSVWPGQHKILLKVYDRAWMNVNPGDWVAIDEDKNVVIMGDEHFQRLYEAFDEGSETAA